jgi:hypothetical protein
MKVQDMAGQGLVKVKVKDGPRKRAEEFNVFV